MLPVTPVNIFWRLLKLDKLMQLIVENIQSFPLKLTRAKALFCVYN